MSDEAFLILDVGSADEWPACFGESRLIPEVKRPTVLQGTRAVAEQEALRLQKAHPAGRFVIFTATDVTVLMAVPTHVNLQGQTLLSEKVARLGSLRDEIPF